MRRIHKLTPLPHFNGDNYNRDCFLWNEKSGYISFHGKYKDIFEQTRLQILIDEQHQQCGYTEIYINNEKECHIDHYIKQEYNQNLRFNWNNYIVATKDNNFGANYKDNTYKITEDEYDLIFNPIIDNIENHFYYNEFGMIREDSGKVEKTITVFNLNNKYLKERRTKIINLIEIYKNGGLSSNDIQDTLEEYGFKSVVEQYCNEEE